MISISFPILATRGPPGQARSCHTHSVDRYVGPGRLEWWANRSTCLGSVDVELSVTVDADGWHASAAFARRLDDDEREGWSFLMDLPPYFTLRLLEDEGSSIDVGVVEEPDGRLTLAAVVP